MSFCDQKQLSVQNKQGVGLVVFTIGISGIEYVGRRRLPVVRKRLANTIDDHIVALCPTPVARVCDIETRFAITWSNADILPVVDIRAGDSDSAQQFTGRA